jgi:cell division protein FtsW (lipid II flippase)
LWQRLVPAAVDRYAADAVSVALPSVPGADALQALCADQSARIWPWPGTSTGALAVCLSDPSRPPDAATLATHVQAYTAMLQTQLDAARAWANAYDQEVDARRRALRAQLANMQATPAGGLSWLAGPVQQALTSLGLPPRTLPREAVQGETPEDSPAALMRQRADATQARMASLAAQTAIGLSPAEHVKRLAFLATGRQLIYDYGTSPPKPLLVVDNRSLADALSWQRRAQSYWKRGFWLGNLHAVPEAMAGTALLLVMVVSLAGRLRPLPVLLWGCASSLLAAGAVLLTDLSLTGPPALRYLAERQFVAYGVGESTWPLLLLLQSGTEGRVMLWLPLLATALIAAMLGLVRGTKGHRPSPLSVWLQWAGEPRWSLAPALVLVALGVPALWIAGAPAAVSEWLILLGCAGLATYLARQAPLANTAGGLQLDTLAVVVVAMTACIGLAVARADLGHALVAVVMAGCFGLLFGGTVLRLLLVLVALAAAGVMGISAWQGQAWGPLDAVVAHLPAHAQQRFTAMFTPFSADSSDLARIRWLMASAGAASDREGVAGWGIGYVPWSGLDGAGRPAGLPLQGPSDYLPALLVSVWGHRIGLLALGMALGVLLLGAWAGLRQALQAATPAGVRALAGLGGFGCLVMTTKALLSLAGVAGLIPLTGVPVAWLGYGPATQAASLLYLTLATGLGHARLEPAVKGVNLGGYDPDAGRVRLRSRRLSWAGTGAVAAVLALAAWHLVEPLGDQARRHRAEGRLALAQAVSGALVAISPPVSAGSGRADPQGGWPCAELASAAQAWDRRLAGGADKAGTVAVEGTSGESLLRLDSARLLNALPVESARACRSLARRLGQLLQADAARILGPRPGTRANPAAAPAAAPVAAGALARDFTTSNPWQAVPGCAWMASRAALTPDCSGLADSRGPAAGAELQALLRGDPWLARDLVAAWHHALREPQATAQLNGRTVPAGSPVGLTLDPDLQRVAQEVADCFTGRRRGASCAGVLPRDPAWQARHFTAAGALRAGAVGLVLAEVDSGRIVALAGALSDCSTAQLARQALPDATGQVPALRDGLPCAQLPDHRSAWLAGVHPALWPVPPGSALKPLSLLAGADAGLPGATDEPHWKSVLAQSTQRLPVQALALGSGERYLQVLAGVGVQTGQTDVLWGGPVAPDGPRVSWKASAAEGSQGLRATSMPLNQVEHIRAQKQAGAPVDRLYGPAVMGEFVAARRLADAALGGGDLRLSALGLVTVWRGIDLRARGASSAPYDHLLERQGPPQRSWPLNWASPLAAARVLRTTSGATSSAWKGTAQGSCRVVFGHCPAHGIPALSAKTGSADFLTAEDSAHAKPGQQLPAKLFGGVFTAANGKRYAVAAMALRVREGQTHTLELRSSAPAEAALTLMRHMGVIPHAAAPVTALTSPLS